MNRPVVYAALQNFCEWDDRPRRILQETGFHLEENRLGRRLKGEEMAKVLGGADAVLAGVEPYDANILAALPRLRCISRCGAGTDSIDLAAARQRGIAVLATADEVVEPVAQMTVAMILSLARNLPLHLADFRQGFWKKRTGFLLSEWTIGLVGFGRIGRAVASYLGPFGPRILAADPRLRPADLPGGIQGRDLPALLREADLVSLHAGRDREEGPLIGAGELALMRRGAFLVNTARGFLVDEAALLDALQGGWIAGAALDVFESEPYSGPLARLPQVVATPHVSTLTRASRAAMELRCAQNLVDFFAKVSQGAG
ncbi:MAG: phosphoglycerate dehydrogenase [Candidatus Omnitrophica bacterium]|nr:phosphoglycerate dehydrogenase [Candidatus Omnitrophota bacterium]